MFSKYFKFMPFEARFIFESFCPGFFRVLLAYSEEIKHSSFIPPACQDGPFSVLPIALLSGQTFNPPKFYCPEGGAGCKQTLPSIPKNVTFSNVSTQSSVRSEHPAAAYLISLLLSLVPPCKQQQQQAIPLPTASIVLGLSSGLV